MGRVVFVEDDPTIRKVVQVTLIERVRPDLASIPIVFMTASLQHEQIDKLVAAP